MAKTAQEALAEILVNVVELATERDRLGDAAYAAYVAAGADTDGATNWRELFRPIKSPSWSEVVRDAVAEARVD